MSRQHRCSASLLGTALLAACASVPRTDAGERIVILHVEVQTSARQQVALQVEDDDAATPAVQATADLPAYSTSRDFAGLLRWILEQKGVAATSGESPIPEHAPRDNEALTLPDGYRVAALTIRKKDGDEWVPSGPADLVRVGVP